MTGEYLEDGRDIIVLNKRGEETEDESLNTLLDYIRTGEVREDDLTQEIEEASERVRYNKDWRERFMTIGEKMERLAREERIKGIKNTVTAMRRAGSEEEKIREIVCQINALTDEQYDLILSEMKTQ